MEICTLIEGDLNLIRLNREATNRGKCMNQKSILIGHTHSLLWNCMKIRGVEFKKSYSGSRFPMRLNES